MTDSNQPEPPKIEFPCENYPIKVIGRDIQGLQDLVIEIMQKHVEDFDTTTLTVQGSSKGSFISIRVRITATGVTQLAAIHEDLMATEHIKMVL